MKQIRKRLTYANVMSSIAVFLVVGGATAFAALGKNTVGSKQLKKNAVTSAKIKNGAVASPKIAAAAVGISQLADGAVGTGKLANGVVTTEKIADNAVTGAKVDEATLGTVPSAETGNPPAFAKIAGDGTLDSNLSKGIAKVTHPSTGTYCITVSGFTPRGGQATPQFGGTYGTTANFTTGPTGFCPSPAVQVITMKPGTPDAPEDETVYVEIYH